jgi:FkbM family methyltransferase
MALGLQLLGSQQALDSVVSQSVLVPMKFAGVEMQIRIAAGDDASHRLPEENGEGYGLDTLKELKTKPNGMMNVVDMGGNYGVVTIAAYKKYPYLVRAVVAEPVPATFFFLSWNMYLNNVTVFDEKSFTSNGHAPGVALLHKGVAGAADEMLRICSPPWSTMNAYLSLDANQCKCLDNATPCHEVQSISSDHMLNLFGEEDITLLKLDCEGCEKASLPVIANGPASQRIKRMVGELHDPDPSLVQLACKWDGAKYFTAFCRGGVGRVDGPDVCTRCNKW